MLESNVQVELSGLQTIDKVLLLLMIHPQQSFGTNLDNYSSEHINSDEPLELDS